MVEQLLLDQETEQYVFEKTVINWAQRGKKRFLWKQVPPAVKLLMPAYYKEDNPDVRQQLLDSVSQKFRIPALTILSDMDQAIAGLGQAWERDYEKRHKQEMSSMDCESDRVLKALVDSSTMLQLRRLNDYPLLCDRSQEQFLFGLVRQDPLMSAGALKNEDFQSLLRLDQKEQLPNLIADSESVRDVAILANQRLVVSIAKHFFDRSFYSYKFDDVLQEGKIGLIKAVDKFKPQMGFKFSTYATWWIRQSIYRALFANDSMVRLPVHWNLQLRKLARIEEEAVVLEKDLTPEEIAKICQISTIQLEKLQGTKALDPISLDRPISAGSGATQADFVHDGGHDQDIRMVETSASARFVGNAMDWILTKSEKEAVELHLIEDRTYPKAGEVMGVTGARVQQLYFQALEKLRADPDLADAFLDYQDSLQVG